MPKMLPVGTNMTLQLVLCVTGWNTFWFSTAASLPSACWWPFTCHKLEQLSGSIVISLW